MKKLSEGTHFSRLPENEPRIVSGVTHKKSVIDYCLARARGAGRAVPRDAVGYALVWELLALMLRQNGVVVGGDIAELLAKNARDHDWLAAKGERRAGPGEAGGGGAERGCPAGSRRGSSASGASAASGRDEEARRSPERPAAADDDALDRFRELLTYGNRQEALGKRAPGRAAAAPAPLTARRCRVGHGPRPVGARAGAGGAGRAARARRRAAALRAGAAAPRRAAHAVRAPGRQAAARRGRAYPRPAPPASRARPA